MKIRNKFIVVLGIFFMLMVVQSATLYWGYLEEQRLRHRIDDAHQHLEALLDLAASTNRYMKEVSDALLLSVEEEREELEYYDARIHELFVVLEERTLRDPRFENEEEGTITKLREWHARIDREIESLFALKRAGRQAEASRYMEDVFEKSYDEQFAILLNAHIETTRREVKQVNAAVERDSFLVITLTIGMVALSLIVAFFVVFRITNGISSRLEALIDAASQFGKGELDTRVDARSADELGQLATTFNQMADTLQVTHTKIVDARNYMDNILHSMMDILVVVTPLGSIKMVNPAALSVLGYEETELLGKPIDTIMGGEPFFTGNSTLKTIEKERLRNEQTVYRAKDGREIPVVFSAAVMRNEGGEVQGIVYAAQDITDNLKMLETIRDSEERFHGITSAAKDAVLLLDDHGKLVYWNPSAERIFGYSKEEVLGQDIHLLLSPKRYHEDYIKGYKNFAVTGRGPLVGKTVEFEAIRKDGSEFPIELSMSSAKLGGKWHSVGILRDITVRKQNEDKLRNTSRALGAMHSSSMVLSRSKSERELFEGVCQNIVDQADYSFVWVGLVKSDETDAVMPVAWAGEELGYIKEIENCRSISEMSNCPVAEVLSSGMRHIVEGIEVVTNTTVYTSVIAIPLLQQKEIMGVLSVYSEEDDAFCPEEERLLLELADDLSYGVTALRAQKQHELAEEKLAHQALHDSLTGLPNRLMFEQALDNAVERARDGKGELGVLFIDLDEFKLINETLGHAFGDALIRQASERIKSVARDSDIVARQGGDEFMVLLARYGSHVGEDGMEEESGTVAQRMLKELQRPFSVNDQEVYLTGSIGISLFPDDADDATQLYQNADNAMYRAKELGRGNYQYFSRKLSERQKKKMALGTMLHKAIKKQEFILEYQPVVDLSSGKMIGVEALIRWEHEKGKLIPPADFLPVAEETGLILRIGDWVIREACRQLQKWEEQNIFLEVAVNLSVRQMWHSDIARKALTIINEMGVSKDLLEFEVTESAMMVDSDWMENTLNSFNENNIRISLDDFGTGYSSLSRLKHLPFSKIKIDKSFVDGIPADEDDMAIVSATMQMAKNLKLATLAEGIETVEQWSYLRNLGCDYGQGYYFSKPVNASEIENIYRRERSFKFPGET